MDTIDLSSFQAKPLYEALQSHDFSFSDTSSAEWSFLRHSLYELNRYVLLPGDREAVDTLTGEVVAPPPGLVLSSISDRGPPGINDTAHIRIITGPQDTRVHVQRRFVRSKSTGVRGIITKLSDKSRENMTLAFRNTEGLIVMLTLTYPAEYPMNGKVVKYHLSRMRKWLVRRGVGGCWFKEFQKRGAPHLHLFLNGKVRKEDVAAAWYRIVNSGDERHLRAGTRIETLRNPHAAGIYAAKYGRKMAQKTVPEGYEDVGRFWGFFGGVRPTRYVTDSTEGYMYDVVRNLRKAVKAVKRSCGRKMRRVTGFGFSAYGVSMHVVKRIVAEFHPLVREYLSASFGPGPLPVFDIPALE